MKFVAYFELNESASPADIMKAWEKIQKAEIEMDDLEVTNWMITAEYWGIAIIESKSADQVINNFATWRTVLPGIYKTVKCAPAMLVEEYGPKLLELLGKLQ